MVETQGDTEWLAQEVDESSFNDRRLGRRFRELMKNFWKKKRQEGNHLEWKLLTNIPVVCNDDAIEKLEWYAHRWKIETFHKILKSCCKAEDSKLRTADRLSKLISCFCIISWRIFWLTMVSREYSDVPAEMALTQAECELLDNAIKDNKKTENVALLHKYIIKLAQLGGYLARINDPPPGNTVLWRGLRRLNDILYGFELSRK